MESALSPAEKKKLLKNAETFPLELREDGTFTYKGSSVGTYVVDGKTIHLQPVSVSGSTLADMERAANEAGRTFGLAWLFSPFQLAIEDSVLVTANAKSVIYTEFVRES
jgi:hypothetical protein